MMRVYLFLLLCTATVVACSPEPNEKRGESCVPGHLAPCPCGGGVEGSQLCTDDSTYGQCACGDAGGGWDLGERRDVSQPVDWGYYDIGYPDWGYYDIGYPDVSYPDVGILDQGRPDMGNPGGGGRDCDAPIPPVRCAEDPTMYAFDSASIIENIFVEGIEDSPVCCFDFTGDGNIDNALGRNLAGFGFINDVNANLSNAVATGEFALLLEHEGLGSLSGTYILNWYQGAWGAGMMQIDPLVNPVHIDPVSLQQGAQAANYFADATLSQGVLTAGRGRITLPLDLFDTQLMLTIRRARLRANVVVMASGIPTPGLTLRQGELGGVVVTEDLYVAVNDTARSCTCLGLANQDLIDVQSGMCNQNADAQFCEDSGNDLCAEIAGACNLWGAIGLFADVDIDGDGLNDSTSIGLSFTARPAQIQGVSNP